MGNAFDLPQLICGGGEVQQNPLGERWHRAVLCRPGAYTEGWVENDTIVREPADGVIAFAKQGAQLCQAKGSDDGESPTHPEPLVALAEGEKIVLLLGEHADGAAALRFGLGDHVLCQCGDDGWRKGTVVGLWYHECGWRRLAPYQIRLDGDPGEFIFAPTDHESTIVADPSAQRSCAGCGSGGELPQFNAGDSVIYTGGGRWAGSVGVLPDWSLQVGHEGKVQRFNGEHRPRGIWPVDACFVIDGGQHCGNTFSIPLTCRDIRLANPPPGVDEQCAPAVTAEGSPAERERQGQPAADEGAAEPPLPDVPGADRLPVVQDPD
eukprot:TRINITY_DN51068_c0_g1_i1.p1 TRINITY_DN51068_c0_g1~~TRINITY_DN51068_c0_g1_i1.p1  ORF type:complete len:346 (+),score=110.96 TRINITY_DN51068_c0_g1_i1:74-1039(+)